MKWYWRGLKNYANFEGRARRKEYWLFHVFNGIICFILFILSLMVVSLFISGIMTAEGYDRYQVGYIIGYGGGFLGYILIFIYQLAVLVPSLAVNVRRPHDTGRSGWWILIGFLPIIGAVILLIFYCQAGEAKENQYGPNPKVNVS
nr:DUF805 domain-containing protein [Bacillus licheniformis]MDH3164418.1 DUF805 domain-containing protein [Bacillus licheniformis]